MRDGYAILKQKREDNERKGAKTKIFDKEKKKSAQNDRKKKYLKTNSSKGIST